MRRFLFLTSSPRSHGNSNALARHAASALAPTAQRWIDLNTRLPEFTDSRPAPCPYPKDDLADMLTAIEQASDIVFVAPIYWYAFPAPLHLLLSHMSNWLDHPDLGFAAQIRTKTVWLITTRADPAPDVPLAAETQLRRSFIWMGATWGGALHGVANAPKEVKADAAWQAASDFLT